MTRLPDWEERLNAFLASKEGVLFTWGVTDCCMFAADAVEAMTGEDPAAEFRGTYTTGAGSIRALKRYGAGALEATLDTKFPNVAAGYARRGDLVISDGMVGVCVGADAVFVGDERIDNIDTPGLIRFPRAAWDKTWQVG